MCAKQNSETCYYENFFCRQGEKKFFLLQKRTVIREGDAWAEDFKDNRIKSILKAEREEKIVKRRKVRAMAMAMALLLLAASPLQSMAASQSQQDDEWLSGKSEYSIQEGDESFYEIESAEDLMALAEEVKAGIAEEGAVYIQTKDIDMAEAEDFEPIGTGNPFTGVYDGQGYKISNLKITSNEDAVGLFGSIEGSKEGYENKNTGTVKNLTVENAEVVFKKGSGVQGVGILAGKAADAALENCTVLGGSLTGTDGVFADTFAGSLAGLVSGESTIVSCKSSETAGAPELVGGYGGSAEDITLTDCLLNGESVQLNQDISSEEAETLAEGGAKSQQVSLVSVELDNIHKAGNEQYVLKDEVLDFDPNTYEYTIELKNSGPTEDHFTFVLDGPVAELSASYRQNDGEETAAYAQPVNGQENTYKVSWVRFAAWGKTDLTLRFNYGTKVSPREKTYVFHILKNTENDNALKNFEITPYDAAGQVIKPLEEHIKSMLQYEALTVGADVRKLGVYAEAENPNNTLSLTYRAFANDEDTVGEIKTIEIPNGEEYFITDCFSQAYADDLAYGKFSGSYVNEFKLTVQPRNNQDSRNYSKNMLWGNFKEDIFLNISCASKWTGNSAVQLQHTEDPEKYGYDFSVREYDLNVMDTSETSKGVLSLAICPKAGASPYMIFGGKKLDLTDSFMADLGYMNQIGIQSGSILKEGETTDVSLDVYADAEYTELAGSYLFHVFYAPSMRIEVSIKDTDKLVPDSLAYSDYAYFLKGEAEKAALQVTGIPENARLTWGGDEVEVTGGTAEIFVTGNETYGKSLVCTYSGDWDGTAPSYSVSVSCKRPAAGMPDTIVDFWPAPGQFTNSKDWGMAPDDNELMNGIGVSLGGFGGYITARLATPIKNDPKNAGGMDFVVKGNAFPGNSEPANVLVSEDGETWYTLAGGYHYEDDCIWDYKITYSNDNPENPDSGTFWKDNQGNSGTIAANGYHAQPYYPLTENYGKYRPDGVIPNSYSCEGVLLPGRVSSWGYVDAAANGITGDIQTPIQGNPYSGYIGFDLSWAVDQDGNPVNLDEISYVKVQNATNNIVPPFGELSAEVLEISTSGVQNNASVGSTPLAADIVVNGQSLNLSQEDIKYGRIVEKTVFYNDENQDFNVSVELASQPTYTYNNVLIGNGSGTSRHYDHIPEHKKIRIVTQSYTGPASRANNPMI